MSWFPTEKAMAWGENVHASSRLPLLLRWVNTVFDACVSFTFFSKTLDPSVVKAGRERVNNTSFRDNMNKNKQAFKIDFVYL